MTNLNLKKIQNNLKYKLKQEISLQGITIIKKIPRLEDLIEISLKQQNATETSKSR
jgi:hypothetical protein